MAFNDVKYENDLGLIMLLRIDDDELAVAGPAPTGDLDLDFHAYASGSRRRFGVISRGVVATAPSGTSRFISVLQKSEWEDLTKWGVLVTKSVGGVTYTITGRTPESRN